MNQVMSGLERLSIKDSYKVDKVKLQVSYHEKMILSKTKLQLIVECIVDSAFEIEVFVCYDVIIIF